MKKIILLVMVILSVMLAGIAKAQIDTSYGGYSPNILASLSKQEPDPVEPGRIVEVSFKLDNNGTAANNVVFEVLPQYPFSLLPAEDSANYVGTLGASQYGKQTMIAKYKLKVAQDAPDDTYQIKARYKYNNFDSWITVDTFKINVQTRDAIIAVDKVETTPTVTAPGEQTKLKLELKNYATSLLKNIKIILNLDDIGQGIPPFSPIGSTNEKIVPYMNPQDKVPIEFNLLVSADAVSKAYKVPLSIKYSDRLNNNFSKTNTITIMVGDAPELEVALERTDVYTSGASGSVVFRLVNKGVPDIRFLNVKVLQNDNVKVIGADEVYIGKLDSDDFSTAEFKVYATGKGSVKIPAQVTYRDTNNNNYNYTRDVELKLYSSSQAKSFGLKKSSSLLWIVLTAIAAAAGYYFYRKKKSKK